MYFFWTSHVCLSLSLSFFCLSLLSLSFLSLCLLSPCLLSLSLLSLSLLSFSLLCLSLLSLSLFTLLTSLPVYPNPYTLPLPRPWRSWPLASLRRLGDARFAFPFSLYCFFLLALPLPLQREEQVRRKKQ